MFTGIISQLGKMVSLERKKIPFLRIACQFNNKKVKIGDSVSVNGACLTVVDFSESTWVFNLGKETLKLANFSDLTKGSYLNLELPVTVNDFLSGHLVSGHLDGTVRLKAVSKSDQATRFSFIFQDKEWQRHLVSKGSVSLNGISLTVVEVRQAAFTVEIIPHTLNTTNFKYLRIGERVNIELDLISKYLYNLTGKRGLI